MTPGGVRSDQYDQVRSVQIVIVGAAAGSARRNAPVAGAAADLAQSMLVTGWNLAIAAGGVGGGLMLQASGAQHLAWLPLLLLVVCGLWVWARPKAWA